MRLTSGGPQRPFVDFLQHVTFLFAILLNTVHNLGETFYSDLAIPPDLPYGPSRCVRISSLLKALSGEVGIKGAQTSPEFRYTSIYLLKSKRGNKKALG